MINLLPFLLPLGLDCSKSPPTVRPRGGERDSKSKGSQTRGERRRERERCSRRSRLVKKRERERHKSLLVKQAAPDGSRKGKGRSEEEER